MANRYYNGPLTEHFDGKRFFHPGLPPSDKTLWDGLRWRLTSQRAAWPKTIPASSGLRPAERVEDLRITAIGHASLLIQAAGTNLLLDPVWATRASPLRWAGPRRRNPPAIAMRDLPRIDCILITHNHYDHMDVAALKLLWELHRPVVISPLGNDAVIHASAPAIEVMTGDWWDSFPLLNGIRATIVPSYHWSARGIGDARMALWGGFVLEWAAGLIYCAGDTAYRDGAIFHQIRACFGPQSLAILPIGAYAPRWFMQDQHVNPEEAVQIAQCCEAAHVLGIHWGTFALTDEPYDEPERRFIAAANSQSLDSSKFVALHPGDVWERDL
jgi:L-ascorbate metabolism protein UlaG (beta-lactamase superfamily)